MLDYTRPSGVSIAPMMDWTDRHCRYLLRLISQRVLLYTEMVTTGAIMVPFGEQSAFHETFHLMETPFDVREGKGGFRYRLSHGEFDR